MHQVLASLKPKHRMQLNPQTYGHAALDVLRNSNAAPDVFMARYEQSAGQFLAISEELFRDATLTPVHGDCHRGNVLYGRDGWFFLDFDDMVWAPVVQDFWLLLPGSATYGK